VNEAHVFRAAMLAGIVLAVLAGIGTVSLLVLVALNFTFGLLLATALMALATVGFGGAGVYFAQRTDDQPRVFTNVAEREVLTAKQRKELRAARGAVVMERALIEVEQERDNITHRAIEAANDPSKPPHHTRWTTEDEPATRRLGYDDDKGYR